MSETEIKKNQTVTVTIDDLAFGGKGVGRHESGRVVFVEGAVPGDTVSARIVKKQSSHAEARLVEVQKPSERRVEPPCEYFERCGGCNYQMLPYADQLDWKQKQVSETIKRLSGVKFLPKVEDIVPSPVEYHYRNKMDYSFGNERPDGPITLGFHESSNWRGVIDIQRCLLHPPECDALLRAMTDYARESGLPENNPKDNTGCWRHFLVRHSVATDQFIAVVITRSGYPVDFDSLAERLRAACPKLQGVAWGITDRIPDIAVADRIEQEWGDLRLTERLGDTEYRVSPFAFFQTNTRGAKLLYDTVREFAEPAPNHALLDAYCGTGTIGIYCADRCRRVIGIESVREAIWDARHNAKLNGLKNCTFLPGMIRRELTLARKAAGGRGFDRLIVDPPRSGMHKKAIAGLMALDAPAMVYVSCNPSTLARDLQVIIEQGYQPTRIRPVDLFPQTYHVEVVIQFKRVSRPATAAKPAKSPGTGGKPGGGKPGSRGRKKPERGGGRKSKPRIENREQTESSGDIAEADAGARKPGDDK